MRLFIILFFSFQVYSQDCDFIKKGPTFSYSPNFDDLTSFWNQELTGVDLVREELGKIDVSKLYGVWDSPHKDHGLMVSNLISGPYESAYLNSKRSNNFESFQKIVDLIAKGYRAQDLCELIGCPAYINISMSLIPDMVISSEKLDKFVETLIEINKIYGSVFIISAGNLDSEIINRKKMLGKDYAVLVSSVEKTGLPSKRFSSGEEISISAPSGFSIVGYNSQGSEVFGATSAATPQVTASLVLFTYITDYKLTVSEAKKVLSFTALPYPHLPLKNNAGAGILNTFKIYKLATELNDLCDKDTSCIRSKLKKLSKVNIKSDLSSKNLFDEARKDFLLNRNFKKSLEVSALYESCGYESNSILFKNLASRLTKSDDKLIKELISKKDYEFLLRYVYSNSNHILSHELLRKLSKEPEAIDYLIQYILPQEIKQEYQGVIEDLVENEENDSFLDFYIFSSGMAWHEYYRKNILKLDIDSEISAYKIRNLKSK